MLRELEAVFEQGVFRPLEPLTLPEHQKVRIAFEECDTVPRPEVNHRREELRWLAKESAPYAGQWVALDGYRLIAYGPELPPVSTAAREAGVENPLLTHVPPDGDLPFGGW